MRKVLGGLAALAGAVAVGVAVALLVRPRGHPAQVVDGLQLLGPSPLSEGLEGAQTNFLDNASFFVLDVARRVVYRLREDCRLACTHHAEWSSNSDLTIETDNGGVYVASLTGSIRKVSAGVAGSGRPGIAPSQTSSDGAWAVEAASSGALAVNATAGARGFLLTNADAGDSLGFRQPAWSPKAPLLAFVGNRCLAVQDESFDLLLFDPERATIENVTAAIDPVLAFAWRNDGEELAVGTAIFGEKKRLSVALVSVDSQPVKTLLAVEAEGLLLPVQWSPDGTKLLLLFLGGGEFCLGGTSEPTQVLPVGR